MEQNLFKNLLWAGQSNFPDLPLKPSAWIGHVPFAQWLVAALQPKILVELGVHHGISYLSFCQAVSDAALDTRCFGVDHWEGDLHAGRHETDVLTELRTFHDPRYAAFSTLVQSSFENALSTFEDGSIDLLHIDGFHTYESVKNDFESWKPKLSGRAVVLFHDIEVRHLDFGVHQLWSELKADHSFFEFHHSYGLGVLGYGSSMPPVLQELFALDEESTLIKVHFKRQADYLNHLRLLAAECKEMRSFRTQRAMAPLRRSKRLIQRVISGLQKRISPRPRNADPLIPPDQYYSVGGGDPNLIGKEFLDYFVELGELKPTDRVLEIGAGTGRIARSLVQYLDQGSYSGLEITANAVAWCKKAYKDHRNFSFIHADIYNKNYNAKGKFLAREYQLPYESESFDFIFLTSVFTHMLPQDVEHYVSEISRVLKKGGRCFATFFLLNGESLLNMNVGLSNINFTFPVSGLPGCLSHLKDNQEAAIAYPESYASRLFADHGLTPDGPVHLGSWCGRRQFRSFQDIIVVRKD